jgi:hypothetical protein
MVEKNKHSRFAVNVSFAPFQGLDGLRLEIHGFTVGYHRSLLRSYKWILKT